MRQNDIKTLRQIIREALRASGRRRGDLEKQLHLGRGNLERLTDGTLRLTVQHLLDLGEVLDVPPTDFLALGCPEAMASARRRLTDWIAPGRPLPETRAAAPATAPVTREEIAAIVREEIRNALQGGAGAGEPGTAAREKGERGKEGDPDAK